MSSTTIPIKSLSTSQLFFKEKFLELTHRRTLDSFRARLNNPRSVLQELSQVLVDSTQNKIKNFATIEAILEEAEILLKADNELVDMVLKTRTRNLINFVFHESIPTP